MASFHNWTGDELIDTQVPQFLNEDNAATQEKLDTKFNKSLDIAEASDLNNFKDEGFYCCNSNSRAETILNCPTNYAFGLMVWGKEDIFYQEVREFNRGSNQDYNNCWRRSYYFDGGQGVWSNWQRMSYAATTLAGYGITDGMSKNATNSVSVADILKRDINTSYLRLTGGKIFDKGANLQLCGGAYIENAGQFLLNAADSTKTSTLLGSPSGLLKWKNKNIVRSVNNIAADENGNVSIDVSGGGGSGSNITVDEEISSTSTNPVQNKAIYSALMDKVGIDEIFNGFALRSPTAPITWMQGSQTLGSLTASNYTGTALRATQDSDGNIINTTYAKKSDISGMVKSVNNVKPDSNGNVAIAVSGGGNVTVDTALSATSTNPVQNRVIKEALDNKLSKTEIAAAALKDGAGNIIANTYAKKTDISGFVKTVNGTAPDSAGNVTINVSGGGSSVTVDTELSGTSNNAIANKAVYNALLNKADTDIFRGFILSSPTATIAWRQGSQRIGSINASNYTGTAAMATSDGDGNTITSTYAKKSDISGVVKSVNGVQPDTNGNVAINVSGGGGVSTSESNTWTGKQTFQKMKFNFESYNAPRISGTIDNPSSSVAVYNVQGNFTLDMSVLAGLLSNSDATLFTAYITANGAYTLSITNAGTLKYVGNASDLAITVNGLLLNILLIKSSSGDLSSVVQASALS